MRKGALRDPVTGKLTAKGPRLHERLVPIAVEWFSRHKLDTLRIAEYLDVDEAAVYNSLADRREGK